MSEQLQIIERFNSTTPLGIRFWDEVTSSVVGSGLVVTAYPRGVPNRATQARPNLSGVYLFDHLPGLRELENGSGDTAFWQNLPSGRPFTVEVVDIQGRFQSVQFEVSLPHKGLLQLACIPPSSPPQPLPGLPLYSAPGRAIPSAMAVVRAELWDAVANAPAAFALLEASVEGRPPARSIADGQGRATLILAYPEPADFVTDFDSPVGATSAQPLTAQEWPVTLRAFYAPLNPPPRLPDLCRTLAQPPADLWANEGRTTALGALKLKFGHELVVRSKKTNAQPLPVLLISPALSPP